MYLMFVILFSIIVSICAVIMIIGYENESGKIFLSGLIGIIVGIIFIIICVYKYNEQEIQQYTEIVNKTWNNGKCSCGGLYELFSTPSTKNEVYYVYKCDNCDHVVTFKEPME